MGAKGIAGHQNLLFLDKCIHRVRPVQVRHEHKLQRPVPDGHLVPVPRRDAHEVPVHNLLQEPEGAARGNDLHLGL